MIFDKRYIFTSAVKYNMLSQMLLLFSFITSCVSSKPVAFFHIICFPKKWLLFSRHMFHQNCLLFSRPQQQLSHNESHYTLWLRLQFPSSISISISISVFKVDLNLDLDFSFASASISISISVFSFDLSFDFSFSGRSQFQLPASTLLEVDFESGFWDLCVSPSCPDKNQNNFFEKFYKF